MEIFLVGGAVRDTLMGLPCKDWDFTVVLTEEEARPFDPFTAMVDILTNGMGFTVFLSDEQHGTVRARAPKGWTFAGIVPPVTTFDFVLARKDVSTDGRRAVTALGTLEDDLARRDFTVNAMAMDSKGNIIDLHNGAQHLGDGILRTVGMAKDRIREDGLRALRAVRFAVTLRMEFDRSLRGTLLSHGLWFATRPEVSVERRREELHKAFRFDTSGTLTTLSSVAMLPIIDTDGLWLEPTLKNR